MTPLQRAILRAKFAKQTPKAVVERPKLAQVTPKPVQIIPIRSLEDEHSELVQRHHEVWLQNEEYRRIIAVINVRQADAATGLSIKTIQRHVAAAFEISFLDLLSERRARHITKPRHVAMYLCHALTGVSYPKIGRGFAGRDHTTAMHGVRRVTNQLKIDAQFAAIVAKIKSEIEQTIHVNNPGDKDAPP